MRDVPRRRRGEEEVARWAAEPIATLQAGSPFAPIVLGPSRIPVVTSSTAASQFPELAVLSALAHGRELGAADIARAALGAAARLDDERRTLYTDLILHALSLAGRTVLEIEMDITDYEFKSDFMKKKWAEALKREVAGEVAKEGNRLEARGEARAVLAVLVARGLAVTDEIRSRVLACTDIPTLDQWITRAATAATAEDVVRDS
jgi:hypothetical protein